MIEVDSDTYALERAPVATPCARPSWGAVAREWLLPSRTMTRRAWPIALGLLYIAAIWALGGLRADHVMIGLLGLLDAYNEKSRLFLRYFLPFILTGVAFDSMRYYYWPGVAGHVHVSEPYLRDLRWFGIPVGEGAARHTVTPNEFFQIHTFTVLDVLCGLAYLVFVAEYLTAAFGLFFTRRFTLLRQFGWSFFFVNIAGFITYFLYPAAPPWYVSQYGLGAARMDVHPSAAAAHRFDLLFGTHFFDQMYGKGIDVFGAYPSLHVAYPFLAAWFTFQVKPWKWARIPAVGFYFLMCLSAIYLQHHYVEDILLGTVYAAATVWVVRRVIK
jgi:membrane-associated phospholipid phosphatase